MPSVIEPLTQREIEIMGLLADGATNAEIGARLHLTEGTVKWYNRRIFEKLGARNRADAVRAFVRATSGPEAAPAPTDDLIGRAQALAHACALVRERRLVTLLGLGGMGKSTLALAVAHALRAEFANGVFVVALAGVQHPADMPATIASAIGMAQSGSSVPTEHLLRHLADKRALLVLDNLDTLVEGAGLIMQLLDAAPRLHVVCTSRERLQLSHETVLRVGGLALTPEPGARHSPAFVLFMRHATRVMPTLRVDAPNEFAVNKICQLVDGMPLAIILAAMWVDTLPPAEIVRELGAGSDLLSTQLVDVPERQRSVRLVLEQTCARLSGADRDAHARLSVFRGGFAREAAAAVAGADIHVLGRLIGRNLLQREGERFAMHELIRQHAAGMLASAEAAEAHARHFLDRLDADAHIDAADFDNLRAAWEHAVRTPRKSPPSPGKLLKVCARLGRYTDVVNLCTLALNATPDPTHAANLRFARARARTVISELAAAIEDFETAGALTGPAPEFDGLQLLIRKGEAQRRVGRLLEAEATLAAALQLAQARNDPDAEVQANFHLGYVCFYRSELRKASEHFWSIAYRRMREQHLTGLSAIEGLYAGGTSMFCMFNLRAAHAIYIEGYARAQQEGYQHYACEFKEMAGYCHMVLGEYAAAQSEFEQAVELAYEANLYWMLAATYCAVGLMRAHQGEVAAGLHDITRSRELAHDLGLHRFVSVSELHQAHLCADLGSDALACVLLDKSIAEAVYGEAIAGRPIEAHMAKMASLARLPQTPEPELRALRDWVGTTLLDSPFRQDELCDAHCYVSWRLGELDQVDALAHKLLDIAAAIDSPIDVFRGNYWLGRLYSARGQCADAMRVLGEALARAHALGYVAGQIRALRALQHASAPGTPAARGFASQAEVLIARLRSDLAGHPELHDGLNHL